MTSLYRSRERFGFFSRLEEFALGHWLKWRSSRLLAQGHSPMAVFVFDYIGHEIYLKGAFELEQLRAMFAFLRPLSASFKATTALDIGGNIGNHSVFFAQHFASVVAFEPNPRTFSLLQANAALTDNVSPRNIGLGNQREELSLRFNINNVGEASLVSHEVGGHGLRSSTVLIEKLDDLSDDLGEISFVKIDVEGFEPQVVEGAAETFKRWAPVIAFEQNLSAFDNGCSQTVESLKSLGYKFVIPRKRWVASNPVAAIVGTFAKIFGGTQFEFIISDTVDPGQYSLILAVTHAHLEKLTAR